MRMIAALLPRDQNGEVLQMPRAGTAPVVLTVTVTSQTTPVSPDALYRVATAEDCWIKFGLVGVTASAVGCDLFPAGVELFVPPEGVTHLAIAAVATTGYASVTKQR